MKSKVERRTRSVGELKTGDGFRGKGRGDTEDERGGRVREITRTRKREDVEAKIIL